MRKLFKLKTTAFTITLLAMTFLISGRSNAEDGLTNIVKKRWHHKWGNKITVESVNLLDQRKEKWPGGEEIKAEFESIVVVKSPIVTDCFTISGSAICPTTFGNNKPTVATGRYNVKTRHTFEKWKSGWKIDGIKMK